MRDKFPGYYAPTEDELKSLWTVGEIVLDANVLLGLYRYSVGTRDELLHILTTVQSQLWLPYQVGLEYQRNRVSVMVEQRAAYNKLVAAFESSKKSLQAVVEGYARHPILETKEIVLKVDEAHSNLIGYLQRLEMEHPDLPQGSAPGSVDKIRDTLTTLFDGRVGDPFTADEISDIQREADHRYARLCPPGYKDTSKDGQYRYGDFIIWKEVLRRAKETQRPIILVTDDRKEDWWNVSAGMTIGPRPELVEEIHNEAGVLFHMYRSDQFMERARANIGSKVSDLAVAEVRDIAVRQSSIDDVRVNIAKTEALIAEMRDRLRELELASDDPASDRALSRLDELRRDIARIKVRAEHARERTLLLQEEFEETERPSTGLKRRLDLSIADERAYQSELDSLFVEWQHLREKGKAGTRTSPTGDMDFIARNLHSLIHHRDELQTQLLELMSLPTESD